MSSKSIKSGRARASGLVLTIVVTVGAIVGVAFFFRSQTYTSPAGTEVAKSVGTAVVHGVKMRHVTLHMQTYPNSAGLADGKLVHPHGNAAWPAYGYTNKFQVPAHSLVTVYERQYDGGGQLNNPWFATVRGTVGGVALINGKVVRRINPNTVGHTFTVRAVAGTDPDFFLSVPFPAVTTNIPTNDDHYVTVVFSFISGSKGTYAWNCEFPCGTGIAGFGGPMGAYGFMSGFIDVV
jgi:hypothetical protein